MNTEKDPGDLKRLSVTQSSAVTTRHLDTKMDEMIIIIDNDIEE